MKALEWSQDFPIITLWELSVSMETRVLSRSGPKPNAANPPSQWCSRWNLIMIRQLVSEISMFESVDPRMEGRRLDSHPISSPGAFCSGELKKIIPDIFRMYSTAFFLCSMCIVWVKPTRSSWLLTAQKAQLPSAWVVPWISQPFVEKLVWKASNNTVLATRYCSFTSMLACNDTIMYLLLPPLQQHPSMWERSGSVVECLTGDRRVAGSTLTALWSLSKTHLSKRSTCSTQ